MSRRLILNADAKARRAARRMCGRGPDEGRRYPILVSSPGGSPPGAGARRDAAGWAGHRAS
eukprot:2599992-Alexandrium_andersonii.AAC.1